MMEAVTRIVAEVGESCTQVALPEFEGEASLTSNVDSSHFDSKGYAARLTVN